MRNRTERTTASRLTSRVLPWDFGYVSHSWRVSALSVPSLWELLPRTLTSKDVEEDNTKAEVLESLRLSGK